MKGRTRENLGLISIPNRDWYIANSTPTSKTLMGIDLHYTIDVMVVVLHPDYNRYNAELAMRTAEYFDLEKMQPEELDALTAFLSLKSAST